MMEIERYMLLLKVIFRRSNPTIEIVNDNIIVEVEERKYIQSIIEYERINAILNRKSKNNTALFDNNNYEILIDRQMSLSRMMDRMGTLNDCENNITYEISYATEEYLLYFLSQFSENNVRMIRDLRMMNSSSRRNEEDSDEKVTDLLKTYLRSLLTLKIKAIEKTESEFNQYYNALRFQLAYNNDLVLMALNSFEDLITNPYGRARRNGSLDELVAPKRIYNVELTNQYYMGLSSEVPFVKFISYYHVIE